MTGIGKGWWAIQCTEFDTMESMGNEEYLRTILLAATNEEEARVEAQEKWSAMSRTQHYGMTWPRYPKLVYASDMVFAELKTTEDEVKL